MTANQGQDLFGIKLDQLEKFARGERLGAAKLNNFVDTVNRNSAQLRPAGQVIQTPSGSGVKQFRFVSNGTDYFVAHEWDGTTEGTDDIHIANPYLLRKTPFDGLTRDGITYSYAGATSRTASKTGEADEAQVIVVKYFADDVIYAVRGVSGGTGVTDSSDNTVDWLDLNVDGRMWAKAS